MEFLYMAGLILLMGIALYTDIRTMRIPNKLTFTFFGSGIVIHFIHAGISGLAVAGIGFLAGFIPMMILHVFRAVAAGDVKFFAAAGIWAGVWLTLYGVLYAVFFSGIVGIIYCFMSRSFWKGLYMLLRYRSGFHLPHKRFPFMIAAVPGMVAGWLHVSYWL